MFGLMAALAVIGVPAAILGPTPKTDMPVTVVSMDRLETRRERQRRARQMVLRCRTAQYVDGNVAALRQRGLRDYEIFNVGQDLRDEDAHCPRDLDTAIAIFEGLAAPDALQTTEPAAAHILYLALLDRDRRGDAERAAEIARMLWLRGDYARAPALPAWTDEERLAFITRDDIWRWLNVVPASRWMAGQQRLSALRDPRSPRHDPVAAIALLETIHPLGAAQALLAGEEVPRDAARAERLLAVAARYDETARLLLVPMIAERMNGLTGAERRTVAAPLNAFINEQTPGGIAARNAMVPVLLEDLANAPAELQSAAIGSLAQYVALGTPAAEAPLLAWTTPRLRDADPAVRRIAYGNIAVLLRGNNVDARRVLDADMARAGGLVDHPPLTLADIRPFINDDDYPSRALRNEIGGIVEAVATVDPSGRVIAVQIIRSADEHLDAEVVRTAMRRIRVPAAITQGRYLRAVLPPVHFLLPDEDAPVPVALPPEGAIVVRGQLMQRPTLETPIPLTTISP